MKILLDADSERSVLSGLIKFGSASYHSISDLQLTDNTFNIDSHKIIFKCLADIFQKHDNVKPDIALIYSAAVNLGVKHWFNKDEEVQYLEAIINFPIKEENVRILARKIKKLEIARNCCERLEQTKDDLLDVSGDESINDIFGILEHNIIDCSSFLNYENSTISLLKEGIEEHFNELEKNPLDQIGISTGWPIYDEAIGGGLRFGTVNVLGARAKVGKSSACINIAKHIAELGIPVLYCDSEMNKIDCWNRLTSCISEVSSREIETGRYINFLNNKNKVRSAIQHITGLPFYYESICGQPIENQIAYFKKWLISEVGLKKDGTANKCVIFYDYLKVMGTEQTHGYQEYQMIGLIMTLLVDFAQKYKIPILATVQLNREGVHKEDGSVISLSDRILWFASSFAIFKSKTQEEIALEGIDSGNRKLIITDARFGPGLSDGDYINLHFNKSISKITEGKTKFEIFREQKKNKILDTNNEPEKQADTIVEEKHNLPF